MVVLFLLTRKMSHQTLLVISMNFDNDFFKDLTTQFVDESSFCLYNKEDSSWVELPNIFHKTDKSIFELLSSLRYNANRLSWMYDRLSLMGAKEISEDDLLDLMKLLSSIIVTSADISKMLGVNNFRKYIKAALDDEEKLE